MKSAETFKNAIKNDDFLSAREARREIFGDLIRKVYDLRVSQPLAKYTIRQLEEKKTITQHSKIKAKSLKNSEKHRNFQACLVTFSVISLITGSRVG